jgi:hypothetical protein
MPRRSLNKLLARFRKGDEVAKSGEEVEGNTVEAYPATPCAPKDSRREEGKKSQQGVQPEVEAPFRAATEYGPTGLLGAAPGPTSTGEVATEPGDLPGPLLEANVSLWDKAYDALKAEHPEQMASYEDLLSRVLLSG